eukprot:Protomagalhaensia_sp_Gyna_25__2193@NODE_2192_length_1231_cov_164_004195_g1813_i0_p1_GENE_NODE_2192_length_1231_cov_164_004195_g1813_i0NODE_2192_length_1231_cov_164_004195_g1813_i0_p1_ORF_typecomplete_len314_score88_60_NODE_2192_length_1231_cov_164_004195_g1813_i01331074
MEDAAPSSEFDNEQVAKARHLRRVRAANVDADLLDDEDWKTARACQQEEAADETEREDKEAFNLRAEEAQGHYDEEGYFIFDNQSRGVDRRIVWGDKEARQKVKRKLGIDDEEEFVDRKLRKVEEREKMMKHRSQRSLEEKEYSSDEDEPVERTRDAWLDDVDQGNVKEVKQSIIEKRQQEQAELDARLDQRHGAGLDHKAQLRRLIDTLETPSQTPADLMRLIKLRDGEEAEGGSPSDAAKTMLKKKKGFQRPRKLSAEAQAKMDTLVDLCDQLTMQGIQVITEGRSELESLLAGGSLESERNEAVESELYA